MMNDDYYQVELPIESQDYPQVKLIHKSLDFHYKMIKIDNVFTRSGGSVKTMPQEQEDHNDKDIKPYIRIIKRDNFYNELLRKTRTPVQKHEDNKYGR